MKMKMLCMAIGVLTGSAVFAVEQLNVNDGSFGLAVPSPAGNSWRTGIMGMGGGQSQAIPCDVDFFESEYGKGLVFEQDRIREFKLNAGPYECRDGKLNFKVPEKGGWALTVGDAGKTGPQGWIIPGVRWQNVSYDTQVFLDMELEQNVPETQWKFYTLTDGNPSLQREFRISRKKDSNRVCQPLIGIGSMVGIGGWGGPCGGFRIECTTPGAEIRIRSIRMYPMMKEVRWRYEFDVPFKPLHAKLSYYTNVPNGEVFCGGKSVYRENRTPWRAAEVDIDITQQIRQGKNVIGYHTWYPVETNGDSLAMEGIVTGVNGEIFRILGNGEWRSSTAKEKNNAWLKPGFDAKSWFPVHVYNAKPENGTIYAPEGSKFKNVEYFTGWKPRHMGLIDTRIKGGKYPVFDYNADNGNYGFDVRIPAGLKNIRLGMEVRNAETGKICETKILKEIGTKEGFRVFDGTPSIRETGAYHIFWTLLSGEGKEIERKKQEMVVCGPVVQEEIPLKEFEQELEKRLELVQEIDCTRTDDPPEVFADHNFGTPVPAKNVGQVVTKNGLTYRETGKSLFDWFAYKLDIKEFGTPMLLEVTIPDTAEHYVCVGIEDVYRGGFNNNALQGWANVSGCSYTGGPWPLSNEKKKLRLVFWPQTKTSCVMITNGQTNKPAAVCDIRLYKIKGGLPALKIPETTRVYGYHLERPLHLFWASDYNFRARESLYEANPADDAWIMHFIATKRKIQYLRYQGHNAAIEGAWMYDGGFGFGNPKLNRFCFNEGMDALYLVSKLYQHNGIGFYAGVEFRETPSILKLPQYRYSDRLIHDGKQGIFCVDRFGHQTGFNSFAPEIENAMRELFRELYAQYKNNGVKGIYLCTRIFLPAIPETYDDRTIREFEQDTGIRLGSENRDRNRFMERWKQLVSDPANGAQGRYAQQWDEWRAKRLHKVICGLRDAVNTGRAKWEIVVNTCAGAPMEMYDDLSKSAADRRDLMWKHVNRSYPVELYAGTPKVRQMAQTGTLVRTERDAELKSVFGANMERSVEKVMRATDAVYVQPAPLNECGYQKADALDRWWWKQIGWTTYLRRPAGELAYAVPALITRNYTPEVFFDDWLDVNLTTAHGAEARRFLKAFYATPKVDFKPDTNVLGVIGQSCGKWLRLVNATAYPVTGTVEADCLFRDMVYDREYGKKAFITMKPYEILILQGKSDSPAFRADFHFARETERRISGMAEQILQDSRLSNRIDADIMAELKRKYSKKDWAGCRLMMDEFEIASIAGPLYNSQTEFTNQSRLETMLREKGAARINCAWLKEYTDEEGNLWLPDQAYRGFAFYGNEYAVYANRGDVPVFNTKAPGMSRTESYGSGSGIYYRVPVPEGSYRVRVHFAELWEGNKQNGRRIVYNLNGKELVMKTVTEKVPFAHSAFVEWNDVKPENGLLSLRVSGGVGINGIEIFTKGKSK